VSAGIRCLSDHGLPKIACRCVMPKTKVVAVFPSRPSTYGNWLGLMEGRSVRDVRKGWPQVRRGDERRIATNTPPPDGSTLTLKGLVVDAGRNVGHLMTNPRHSGR